MIQILTRRPEDQSPSAGCALPRCSTPGFITAWNCNPPAACRHRSGHTYLQPHQRSRSRAHSSGLPTPDRLDDGGEYGHSALLRPIFAAMRTIYVNRSGQDMNATRQAIRVLRRNDSGNFSRRKDRDNPGTVTIPSRCGHARPARRCSNIPRSYRRNPTRPGNARRFLAPTGNLACNSAQVSGYPQRMPRAWHQKVRHSLKYA